MAKNKTTKQVRKSIARQLILVTVLFSILVTLLTTAGQLYLDYKNNVAAIHSRIEQIRNSLVAGIAASVWSFDDKLTNIQLDGLLRMPDIEYLSISRNGKEIFLVGKQASESFVSVVIPLDYQHLDQSVQVGELRVVASLDAVYGRLIQKGITILLSVGVLIFIVTGFLFIMMQRLVTRHLYALADYTDWISLDSNSPPLVLDRPASKKGGEDELDSVVNSINATRSQLTASISDMQLSEQRQAMALFGADLGLWDWNLVSGAVVFDARWCAMIGRKTNELAPHVDSWRAVMHPSDTPAVQNILDVHLKGETPHYEAEFRLQHSDGHWVWILARGRVVERDSRDRPLRMTGTHMDITEKKRSEKERVKLEEQVRRSQKMDAVGQLTGGIAHDFNNILGIVQGNFEILQKILKDNDKAKARIEAGLKGSARGAALTRKLLDFSRKEIGNIQRISINGFIQEMENLIVKSLTVSISVELHLDEDAWQVDIDTGDLQDVIVNLALNARDAMPDGGNLVIESRNKVLDEKYAARTSGSKAGDFVMLSVSDTGHGMTAKVKELVLEPFFTTKEQGKGTGLGLSMVYGFVQRSGGHIEIYSEPDKGTTIHLYLPRAVKKLISSQAAEITEVDSLPTGAGTILIVDDEEDLREIAVFYLESLGYQTRTAENGDKAMEILSDGHDIDLLFSDVVMPGEKDGYQLAETAHQTYPELKVLLTSGFTRKRSKLHGAGEKYLVDLNDKILDKPYNLSELAFAIQATFNEQD